MTSKSTVGSNEIDREALARGRTYTVIGFVVLGALVVVAALGYVGTTSPGWLSSGEAFFVLGAALVIVAMTVVGLLISLKRTIELVRGQQAAIDQLQDHAALERSRAQDARDSDQELALNEIRQRVEDRIEQLEHAIERVGSKPAGASALDAVQDKDLAAIRSNIATIEARLDELAAGGAITAGAAAEPFPPASPFGDIHPVIDVEGIGEVYADALSELNIVDTEQLWFADAEAVAAELDVSPKVVRSWQQMSELMALDKVGPQYAEVLVRAGFTSVDELAMANAEDVFNAIDKLETDRDVRVQGGKLSPKVTASWIEAASTHDAKARRIRR